MSSAPVPHGHDAHDDHAFTGEPVQVLPPDEPRTPGWVPLLGVALFTTAAVIFLAGSGNSAKEGGTPAAATANPAAAAEPPKPAPAQPTPAQPTPTPRPITPEQRDQVMQRLGQGQPAGSARPGPGTPVKLPSRPRPPADKNPAFH
jgi:hypothetical protein